MMLLAAGAASCAPAFAAPDERSGEPRDEIFVNAGWRDIAIDDVPVFAVVLDGEALRRGGVSAMDAVFRRLPNAARRGDFTRAAVQTDCRGFNLVANGRNPCSTTIDGREVIDARLAPATLHAIDGVSFLTGLQSPFRANAIAGGLDIATRRPGDAFAANALLQYGNGGRVYGEGGVSGRVAEGVRLLVDGYGLSDNGRIENVFLGEAVDFNASYRARIRAVVNPAGNLEIDAQIGREFFNAGTAFYAFLPGNTPDAVPAPTSNRAGRSRGWKTDAIVSARLDLGAVNVTSVSGYSRLNSRNRQDLDYANPSVNPGGVFGLGDAAGASEEIIDAVSQEVRLSFSNPRRGFLDTVTVAGVYHFVDFRFPALFQLDDLTLSDAAFFSPDNPSPVIFAQGRRDRTDIGAVVASASFNLTDRLSLDAALRAEWQTVRTDDDLLVFSARETLFSTPYKATASYRLDPALGLTSAMVFFSVGEGVRGPNPNSAPFDFGRPERARTIEGGFKTALMDGRFHLTGALFSTRVRDFQIFTLVDAAQFVVNFDRVRMRGAEGRVAFTPNDRFTAYAAVGALDTIILDAAQRSDLVGNETPYTMRTSVSVGASVTRPVAPGVDLIADVNAFRQGRRVLNAEATAIEAPAILIDASAGGRRGPLALSAYVRNAANTAYAGNFVPRENTGRGTALGLPGDPRAYGLQLIVEF